MRDRWPSPRSESVFPCAGDSSDVLTKGRESLTPKNQEKNWCPLIRPAIKPLFFWGVGYVWASHETWHLKIRRLAQIRDTTNEIDVIPQDMRKNRETEFRYGSRYIHIL